MRLSFVFIILIFASSICFAQDTEDGVIYDDSDVKEQSITEESLDKYKSDDDFNYIEVENDNESAWEKFKAWLRNILTKFWEAIFGVGSASGFLYFVFRILPYILLGVLVYLLVRFFLKVNSNAVITASKEKGSISYSEEEEIIKSQDIPALIKDAIRNKNYRLAIRYYYLLALKQLTDREIITWQAQKTNEDYIKELNALPIRSDFEHITRIYDYVWYGEFDVDNYKFEALKIPFEQLSKSILKT